MKKLLFLLFFFLCFNYRNSEALDCIEGSIAQKNITGCSEKVLDEETKKLDSAYKAYIKFLDGKDYKADEKKNFKESHIAWIKYKDLHCKFMSSSCEGGSMCGMVWASCHAAKTKERRQEIEEVFEYEKRL